MRNLIVSTIVIGMSVSAAVHAQQAPAKKILLPSPAPKLVTQIKPTGPVFDKPIRIVRPGTTDATTAKNQLISTTARFKRPAVLKPLVAVAQLPGIASVNGNRSGTLEPGGDYEIKGSAFGTATGSVFVRVAGGRTIPMSITHWSDTVIYASMPGDISGLPDSTAELAVGPKGKEPFKSTKFGFRAAREDINLPISNNMFKHEGAGTIQLGGVQVPVTSPAGALAFDGKWYRVTRSISDGDEKKCIVPGRDRISWGSLKNGYEVTSFYYERMPFAKSENDTPRGSWNFAWDGNSIRVDFGVMRHYTPRYVLIGGDVLP